MQDKNRALLFAAAILSIFLIWNVFKSTQLQPSLLAYDAKFSIFFRNYQTYGIGANHLFPALNLKLTNPPSPAYLSESPFLSLVMFSAARLFGDRPMTYRGVILIINICFFLLLTFFVKRRWGMRPALWTLFFAALSPYAFRHGYEQTFEQLCVLGMFSSTFLYFEWFRERKDKYLILSVVVYLVGFAASYLALFSAAVICTHYLLFEKKGLRANFFKMSLFPLVSFGYVLSMSLLILTAGLSIRSWLIRVAVRSTGVSRYELLSALFFYPLKLFGPILIATALCYFFFRHRKPGFERGALSDLALLYCLLIPGLLTCVIFRNLYVNHPYIVVFFLPFFVVSASLAVDHLLQIIQRKWLKRIVACVFTFSFLASSLFLPEISRLFNHTATNNPCKRVADLSQEIKQEIRPQDKLFVLNNELIALTAFYILWIPTFEFAEEKDLAKQLEKEKQALVLCSGNEMINWIRKLKGSVLVASGQDIAFFRIIN